MTHNHLRLTAATLALALVGFVSSARAQGYYGTPWAGQATYPQPTYAPRYGPPPAAQPGYPGAPTPSYGYRSDRPRRGLIVAGSLTLGITWGLTVATTAAVVGITGGQGGDVALTAIPVVGPWACLAGCEAPGDYAVALVLSGLVQAGGLTMLVLGAVMRTTVEMPTYTFGSSPRSARLTVSPTDLGGRGAGVNLSLEHF